MHRGLIISFVIAGLLGLTPHASGQQQSGDAIDKMLSISDVPRVVLNAARAALRATPTTRTDRHHRGRHQAPSRQTGKRTLSYRYWV